MTNIFVISDTHTYHDTVNVPECDILLSAGDFTWRGEYEEVDDYVSWLADRPAKHKVLICGNHEVWISKQIHLLYDLCASKGIIFLHNDYTTVNNLKIWGSPHTTPFGYGWAYNAPEPELEKIYSHIPDDVDIIMTHSPVKGILDLTSRTNEHVGSESLYDRIQKLPKLKLHVCGHIHESHGVVERHVGERTVIFANAAHAGYPKLKEFNKELDIIRL